MLNSFTTTGSFCLTQQNLKSGGEKEEKQRIVGHLRKVGEVNGTQSILLIIASIIMLYGENKHNLLRALREVK